MKLTKFLLLFLFLSIKGFSQQAVLTSSGEKVILNFLSSSGGTITGTLGVTGNTTISGTTTLTGVNNTGTITNTGALINNGNLTVNGNGTITGTLTTSGTINDLTVSRGGGNVNGNTAVGGSALNANNNTGINNAAFGSEALLLNQGGGHNTALGKDALRTNVSGNYSTAVGYQSLNVNTVSNNTAIGYRSMSANSTGTDNTAIGYQSLDGNSTGTQNTAIGSKANMGLVDLSNTTAIGYFAIATTSNTIQLGNAYITKINTSGAITAGGMQNTPIGSSIANTGAFTTLSASGATTITGTLTLPSLSASTLLGTNGSSQLGTVSLTGDITTIGLVATLSNTGVIVGTYGSSTTVPQITVDSKGRITTITTTTNTHTIGESYGGGKVFYVYDNGQHGLIAATADQNGGSIIRWNGGSNINTRARADGVGAGLKNTAIIIGVQASTISPTYDGNAFAATVCNEYTVTATTGGITTTYGDWYLPSKEELFLLWSNRLIAFPGLSNGGFALNYYWSSTELDYNFAWLQYFTNGSQSNDGKGVPLYVRAIRAF